MENLPSRKNECTQRVGVKLQKYPQLSSIKGPPHPQICHLTGFSWFQLSLSLQKPKRKRKIISIFSDFPVFVSFKIISRIFRQELANSQGKALEETTEPKNQQVVLALYDALKSRDVKTVHQILAPDLEWWFHGPPTHQFMMRLLTGSSQPPSSTSSSSSFEFVFTPQHVQSFGPTVIAEGCDQTRQISWVHAWTVTDGIITQVREYFNTSLTVTRLGPSGCSPNSSKSSSSTVEINSVHCPSVWESYYSNRVGKSVPGLVLAI